MFIMQGKVLCSRQGQTLLYSQKKTLHSCFWEVNLWANASFGGILFRVVRSVLNKRKKIGNRGGSYCLLMTIKNLFHCLTINQSLQAVHQGRNHFRDLQLY